MKYALVTLCVLASLLGKSQGTEAGDITFGVGIDGGLYKTSVTQSISAGNFELTEEIKDTAAAWFVPIHVEYCLHHLVSAGVMMKFGKYLVEEKERESQTNNAQVYGFTIDFHPLKNDYFDPYVRITNGFSTLKINHVERASNGVILTTNDSKSSGYHFEIDAGIRAYFGRHIGLNIYGGYNIYNLNLKELTINGTPNTTYKQDLVAKGAEFGMAIIGRF
ncbi:MAG: hypothetical protein ACI84C_000672 [Flavobacteriales bacterium]|jgi:hypothetical protein